MKLKHSIIFAALLAQSAQAADFELKGYGVHVPGLGGKDYAVDSGNPIADQAIKAYVIALALSAVEYRYTLVNNTASNLADPWEAYRFEIGLSVPQRQGGKPELIGLPPVYTPPAGSPPEYYGSGVLAMAAPTGWRGFQGGEQEHINHTVVWELGQDALGNLIPAAALLPGQTLSGMNVTRLGRQPSYLEGGFIVSAFTVNTGPKQFIGRVTKQDTQPPVLSVTLNPSTLKKSEKLVSIAAAITVKDDYDPLPAIVLESITANEPLEKEDIKDAKFGTDDRQFKLKAEREGKNKAGRIYTVTYSATDGTGNKATASATVTVPHDERKKDD